MTSREEFAAVMRYLFAGIGKPFCANQTEVYFDLLGDLPLVALQLAARQALLESRYPTLPTAGTLRQLALEKLRPRTLTAMEAWDLVCAAVNRFGLSRRDKALATLPEPARRAVCAIGWEALCDMPAGGGDTIRAQFRDAYGQLATLDEREALPPAQYQQQARELLDGVAEGLGLEREPRPALPHKGGAA